MANHETSKAWAVFARDVEEALFALELAEVDHMIPPCHTGHRFVCNIIVPVEYGATLAPTKLAPSAAFCEVASGVRLCWALEGKADD